MKYISSSALLAIKNQANAGVPVRDIAQNVKVSLSATGRLIQTLKKNTDEFDRKLKLSQAFEARHGKRGAKAAANKRELQSAESAKLAKKVMQLREQGLTLGQIVNKSGLSLGRVNYLLYTKAKALQPHKESMNGNSNHASTAETNLSDKLKWHLAFKELERLVSVLSERLGFPVQHVRREFYELLGNPPLR